MIASIAAVLLGVSVAQAPALDPTQNVSPAEIESFVQQVKSCWTILPEDVNSGVGVTLLVELDRDGTIDNTQIAEADDSPVGQRIARSALRAVERCAPYAFSAETYALWKQLRITLQP
jgi:hypothetical protein